MTKSGNLKRALEARRIANAEREARERAIVQSLKEFLDELDKLDHTEQTAARDAEAARAKAAEQIARIEKQLNERLERIGRNAEAKAAVIRQAAGAAVQTMRANGETVASIAAQSGQTQSRVRELLRVADSDKDDQDQAGDQAASANGLAEVSGPSTAVSEAAAPVGEATYTAEREPTVPPADEALTA